MWHEGRKQSDESVLLSPVYCRSWLKITDDLLCLEYPISVEEKNFFDPGSMHMSRQSLTSFFDHHDSHQVMFTLTDSQRENEIASQKKRISDSESSGRREGVGWSAIEGGSPTKLKPVGLICDWITRSWNKSKQNRHFPRSPWRHESLAPGDAARRTAGAARSRKYGLHAVMSSSSSSGLCSTSPRSGWLFLPSGIASFDRVLVCVFLQSGWD